MTTMPITVTWGEAIAAKARQVRGGLNAIATAAQAIVGPTVGSRTTFAKLYSAEGPPDDAASRFRAWLVLAVCDELPEDWGLSDADVPSGFDPVSLREQVILAFRWGFVSAGDTPRAA